MSRHDMAIDGAIREQVVEKLAQLLETYYVVPEVGSALARHLRDRRQSGAYDAIASAAGLCDAITAELRRQGRDRHLALRFTPERRRIYADADVFANVDRFEELRQEAAFRNFGIERIERLAGNVGYLDLRALYEPRIAGEKLAAALGLLADVSAVILDLRENPGGHPHAVALVCSYFLGPGPVHLNSFYNRAAGRTEQFWTLSYVPGRRYLEGPVYVLVSRRTGSAAEELAYNLQQLQRATVVGRATFGAAQAGVYYQIDQHFEAFISTARAVNPISGTNWEGTGVKPDIEVPPELALQSAQALALEAIVTRLGLPVSRSQRALLQEAQQALAELRES
ncbi:MAG: S41 family peptidase [Chloroflexi bacterium]|nr:S41 family peptidase [Chloroflexota bacterium]